MRIGLPLNGLGALSALLAFSALGCSSSDASKPGGPGAGADSGTPATTKIDRSGLTDVGTTESLDYSNPNFWMCRPGNDPNECHDDLTATNFAKDNTQTVVPRKPAQNPAFDCFYVYPTVKLTPGTMTDFSDTSFILDPLLSQGAPFSSICEVYAPLYRQASLSTAAGADGGVALGGDINVGFDDVEAAFDYYIDHLSKGRNFVLLGHSQGSFALTKLIVDKIDTHPELRSRMISALLLGGNVTVPTGRTVGGSFQNVPLCSGPGQTGCVIAYNSYAVEAPPGAGAVFGKAPTGSEIGCTAPGPLANNSGNLAGSYSPSKIYDATAFKPDLPVGGLDQTTLTTPFGLYRDFFKGECVEKFGAHYYEISTNPSADDKRQTPLYRSTTVEAIGFGLHISDYNLSLDDLLAAVKLQAAAMK